MSLGLAPGPPPGLERTMMKMGSPKEEGKKKLLKPLMEKRRRERMNRSLARLRVLLLEATRDERLRNPKVEKAEILQKTVEFLKTQPLPEGVTKEENLLESYRSGHRQCLAQATDFLRASPGLCPAQKAFCVDRIGHCMEQLAPRPQPELPCAPLAPSNPRYDSQPCYSPSVFGGCSPPLGGPAFLWAPGPTPSPSGSGLQACPPSLAPLTEGCSSRAPQSRLSERWGPTGLRVWRPWP
ncbi:transcription factor HES-7.1-like [Ahaetulla prasina]|uniref:transcription factor HES-7.1-like n=1 Tax=Ahaetulla prasina TaxID=499056 RepID=UPI002649AA6C|nr:transcription factor HES-7.1-like [Ahaetulla prasina]